MSLKKLSIGDVFYLKSPTRENSPDDYQILKVKQITNYAHPKGDRNVTEMNGDDIVDITFEVPLHENTYGDKPFRPEHDFYDVSLSDLDWLEIDKAPVPTSCTLGIMGRYGKDEEWTELKGKKNRTVHKSGENGSPVCGSKATSHIFKPDGRWDPWNKHWCKEEESVTCWVPSFREPTCKKCLKKVE